MATDILYLVSTQGNTKYGIKFGCSKDFAQRQKTYNTHNPFAEFPYSLTTPSRAFSEALENALLRKIGRYRKSNTEWYIVNEDLYNQFQELKNYREVFAFCDFFSFLFEKIQVYESRLEAKETNKKRCLQSIQHYKTILEQTEELMQVHGD